MKLITWPNYSAEYLLSQGLSPNFPQRFWAKVDIRGPNDCWLWKGRCGPRGHGEIFSGISGLKNNNVYAHRAVWILCRGPIPKGKMLLHKCPGRHHSGCVNPAHLKPGGHGENGRDMTEQFSKGFLPKPKRPPVRSAIVKLSQQKADEIWNKYTGKMGQLSELAKEYGVCQGRIANMIRYGGWGYKGPHPAFVERQRRIALKHLPKTGERKGCKLQQRQVDEIRQKYTGKRGQQSALAREYHVRQGNIWSIVNHLTWK